MNETIRLAISTCPNDTFAFHALMNGLVDMRGLQYEIELLDIQQLNDRLVRKEFDIIKASFAAAVEVAGEYWVLPSGSALGFGVGPLLLAAKKHTIPSKDSQITLCPGKLTTATLLFEAFYPDTTLVEHRVFSEIMPQLSQQQADFGVCIHEGRFTWQEQGLHLVQDLGTRWEHETNCPLPLGGIFASRQLEDGVIQRVQTSLRDSIDFARTQPELALPTMRKFAQELNDSVLMQHVDLYVNQWTLDLGEDGADAIEQLCQRARGSRLVRSTTTLEIFSCR